MKISVKDKIKDYMREEALKPEAAFKLPSMRELIKRFNVSLVTVTRAVKELESEGVIICRHGSGIVAARGDVQDLNRAQKAGAADKGSLILCSVDYPSERLWNNIYMVEEYARQRGYRVINCKMHQNTDLQEIAEFAGKQENCSGLLLMSGAMQLSAEAIGLFGRLPMPVALTNSMFVYDSLPENLYVLTPDGISAGMAIGEHLHANGHRNVGLVRNEPATEYNDGIIHGINKALKGGGDDKGMLHVFPSVIRNWGDSKNEARRITVENLEKIRSQNITALVYASSIGAFASMPILREAGFRLPEDLSIITGGDAWFCEYSEPALTASSADFKKLCFKAVDIIVDVGAGNEHVFRFPERLVVRNSVKNLK